MENSDTSCCFPVNPHRTWPYHEYYIGKEDQEGRRNGQGQNHWNGAESLEWYNGKFVRDMMHGEGEYRWRYRGPEGAFITYEGQFYGNSMHGYGILSYPNGTVFNGIFHHNMRWGPGIESHINRQENVGLWRGNQLVRLTWRPDTPSFTFDLNHTHAAKAYVESYRSLLTTRIHTIGKVNSAIELLKLSGSNPIRASENWTKLYPGRCTDLASQLCHNDLFDYEYYKNNIVQLEEVDTVPENDQDDDLKSETYYAWNNSEMVVSMMKHCFKHEMQRSRSGIDMSSLLSGPRSHFKNAAKHEIDCRTLLLASYLGHIKHVAQLVNEENVHPDVADILGNTALMYAACGDQADTVHFLVEAGGNVNSFSDSCCTPLGLALIKYACAANGIPASGMVQAMLPPPPAGVPATCKSLEGKPSEWHIIRDLAVQSDQQTTNSVNTSALKKDRKKSITEDEHKGKKKTTPAEETTPLKEKKTNQSITPQKETDTAKVNKVNTVENLEEKQLFDKMNNEFVEKVIDLLTPQRVTSPLPSVCYLFEVTDMVKEVDANIGQHKNHTEVKHKSLALIKTLKENAKASQVMIRHNSENDITSESSVNARMIVKLNQTMSTIVQLLSDGADPRLVRCPQPALRIALASGSADLLRQLVKYGADIDEVYPDALHYTILDLAVSQPLSHENLALLRVILECGARADHKLRCLAAENEPTVPEESGPTLLHVALSKRTDDHTNEVRNQLLELLLEYKCDALAQFRGMSAVDMCMMTSWDTFDIFVKCPRIDLNAIINAHNQTVLVKMFSPRFCTNVPINDRLHSLTNLLLYGADPLLECQDEDEKYANIFVYAKQVLAMGFVDASKQSGSEVKGKKSVMEKTKKNTNEKQTKAAPKPTYDDTKDYKQALDLVKDCARILHIRWIQAKLLKELIQVVIKYEHRPWNMILSEHKNKKASGFWLSCSRSLEIWEILKINSTKKFNERRILKHVLSIVQFNSVRAKTTFKKPLTSQEKEMIDNEVYCILHEHKVGAKIAADINAEPMHFARPYVTPELSVADKKFNVCFDCALPLEDQSKSKILCICCKQVYYCSLDCMKINIRTNASSHPCSEYLKVKYCLSLTSSDTV